MNKKRVLFIRSNPVDADSRVQKEVSALCKGNYEVSVLGWDRDADYPIRTDSLQTGGMTAMVYRVGIKAAFGGGMRKNLIPLLKFQLAIRKFLQEHQGEFDVVHACDFDTAFAAYHTIDHRKVKMVYDIFDYYVEAFQVPQAIKSLIEKLDHAVINGADATIICTEQRRKQIAGAQPRRLSVIHNAPPRGALETSATASSKIKVAYFGILSTGRLLEELLDVIAQNKNYELHIGGFGILEDVVTRYAAENENIIFYGKLAYQDVLYYENQCDLMTAIYDPAVPNHIYAAPNKFYEGLMLGKPLIMVRGTGMSDVVLEHQIGAVMDYNAGSLLEALNELGAKRAQWSDMAKKMKKLYEDYSWDMMERRLLELYASLTE